jgi:CheY-like chemotaxis protein
MASSITESSATELREPAPSPREGAMVSSPRNDPASARAPVAPSPANRRVILVVDDQASVCTAVAYYLEICGYRTFRAESGQAAIEICGREQIDGVLLDVQMPQMNGFETSKRLHAVASGLGRQLKVWFMTAIHYRESQDHCAAAGGLGVFQKPFEWPHLLAELARGLNPAAAEPARPSADPSPPQA